MFDLVIQLAVFAGIAFFGARGLGGVTVRGGWTSLVIAILFSVLSALLGVPVTRLLLFLGAPLTCLTLGLFALAVPIAANAALLRGLPFLVGRDRFEIEGWMPAIAMGVLFGIGQVVLRVLC